MNTLEHVCKYSKKIHTSLTRSLHRLESSICSGVISGLSPRANRPPLHSSKHSSQASHVAGNRLSGAIGGKKPVLVSTSKSCAAKVDVSTWPVGMSCEGGKERRWVARKWVGGSESIAIVV